MDHYRRIVDVNPNANAKIAQIIKKEPDKEGLFRAAIQSLKEDYHVPANGTGTIDLLDRSCVLEFEVETDRTEKARYITVTEVR